MPELAEPDAWPFRLFVATHFTKDFAGGLLPTYRYHATEPRAEFPVAPRPTRDTKAQLWRHITRLVMTPGLARVCSVHLKHPLDAELGRRLLHDSWSWLQEDLEAEGRQA